MAKDDKILAIRQKANQKREEERRRQARRNILIQVGVIVAVLAVVAGIIFGVMALQGNREVAVPDNSGTITVGDTENVPFEVTENAIRVGAEDAPVTISLYEDYSCPHCAQYEATVGDTLTELIADGDTAVEYNPINIVTMYGKRAGSAATCVAVHEPESWLEVHSGLFAVHDASTDRWSNDQIADFLDGQGINGDELLDCVREGRYVGWIDENTAASRDSGVQGTPSVFINGEKLDQLPNAEQLRTVVAQLAADEG